MEEKFTIKMDNICRACSSTGSYNIFAPIPPYLHETLNEHVKPEWLKNISTLLEETTGLKISPDDGLPNKMCAICISYLKHASIFRQQVIDTTLSLKAAMLITNNSSKSLEKCYNNTIELNDIDFIESRQANTQEYINDILKDHNKVESYQEKAAALLTKNSNKKLTENDKILLRLLFPKNHQQQMNNNNCLIKKHNNNKNIINKKNNFYMINTKRKFFSKSFSNDQDFSDSNQYDNNFEESLSDDDYDNNDEDYDASENTDTDLFNYVEKNFIEDDVMESEVLKHANITISIPEDFKERKCRACRRRFMSEKSCVEHSQICFELNFLTLSEQLNYLLNIRRSQKCSPREYIRRVIFILKKSMQWLNSINFDFEDENSTQNETNDDIKQIVKRNFLIVDEKMTKKLIHQNDKSKLTNISKINAITASFSTFNLYSTRCDSCQKVFTSLTEFEKHIHEFHNKFENSNTSYEQVKQLFDEEDKLEGKIDILDIPF